MPEPVVNAEQEGQDLDDEDFLPSDRPTFHELLNNIRCNNILLSNSIPLGDALYQLAVGIGKSGATFEENGNVKKTAANRDLGKLIHETLTRRPRTTIAVKCEIGFDPGRCVFTGREAQQMPIQTDTVILLPLDESKRPVTVRTDSETTPVDARSGIKGEL